MPAEARQGAAIPFRHTGEHVRFCLVTTSSGNRWTFPKGIVEPGDSPRETALKEAFEEAGLHGTLVGDAVGSFQQAKWGTTFTVQVYLMDVTQADETWEEQSLRRRRWCDGETALALLEGRPGAAVFLEATRRVAERRSDAGKTRRP